MTSAILYQMSTVEHHFDRPRRGSLLDALAYIVEQAEDPDNARVWFTTVDLGRGERNKGIIVSDIGALSGMPIKLGFDFDPANTLRGMQAATQDYDGYCMTVYTINDLNSAEIPDLSELVYRIRMIDG